ncbi:MAG: hypothetical protein COA31_001055 [Flavobacteriales bacterium]|jgi:hypothetical protein|nr:hypothetical protein [Flavobacteriales bacterium]|tara:strand:+ start:180 stop:578 length:399 start_codon:yes stop_codon:yes gene_type:complete
MKMKSIVYPVLALLTIGYAKAEEKREIKKEIITINENLNEWVLVKEEKGIKVYFLETTGTDGVTFLNVKFENTLNEVINFKWVLKKDSDSNVFENTAILEPFDSIELDQKKIMITINKEESRKDFSLNIYIQ